jgi:hypothetical protein
MQNSDKLNDERTDNFKLGQFKTKVMVDSILVDQLIEPLSQNDMAEDWQLVLPTSKKNSTKHHFNIYLSQLPQHLWKHLERDTNEYYKMIKDNIYNYSVKISDTDESMFRLFNLLNTADSRVHYEEIRELYSFLYKMNVRGWIMIKTKKLIF